MNKIPLVFLVLFYSIPAVVVPSCHAALNLAKGKPYSVSPPPQNYPLSAPPSNTTALTDGTYTVGHFWTPKTTVGWQRTKMVEILIDLEKESNIGSITFSTARGEKEGAVYYPTHIAAFVGTDREHLMYVGDLADDSENLPGSYQTKMFKLNNVGTRGRYVLLEAIPRGVFLFCDEIEVIEGNIKQRKPGSLTLGKAHEFVEQLIRLDREKELLNKMAENVAALFDKQTGVTRLNEIKRQISELQSVSNIGAIESELLALRGTVLTKNIPSKTLYVQAINPWVSLNPVSPVSNTACTSLSFVAPKYGYDSGAVLITNLSTRTIQVTTTLDKVPNGLDLFLYHVPFVKSAALEQVADPLIPAKRDFDLRPGESRMLFATAFGKQSGKWSTTLHIKSDGNVTSLPITIQVVSVEMPNKFSLNAINWSYLDFKLTRDRQQTAAADLLAHHTNVVVVSPAFLQNTIPVKPLDFSRLESYLKLHKGADKVFLYMNLRTDNRLVLVGGYPFLGEQWKTAVKKWYEGARQAAVRAGFKADQVYLYPFDEMEGKEIDQFIALAQWARSEIPGVRLYATLGWKDAQRALPYLDIAQVAGDYLQSYKSERVEMWLYDAKGPSKSLSPYSYYRLMAWKAFLYGYKGIGFWAYADTGRSDNPDTTWDDFGSKYPNYAVIYEGSGTSIISSRRWEGWRMGIEDYELLTMYSKAKGDAVAKALAKSVLDNPLDTTKADEVRRKILLELYK